MSELNNIPLRQAQGTKHWQVRKLGEIFTIERGGSPRPIEEYITSDENGINWIKIGDTKDVVKYIYQTKEKIKPEGAKRSRMVYEDDFILSNSMSFGRPYIMKTQGCIHDGWLVIRKNEMIDSNYLYLILSSSQVYQQFTHLAKGSTVKNLNIQAVKEVVISFPPLPEQLAIVSKIEELLSDLENGKQQLLTAQQQLKVYRQSLLKAAFTSTTLSDRRTSSLSEAEARSHNTQNERSSSEVETKDGELPEGWKWVKLGDFALKITDGEHITPKRTSEGFYLLSARNIQNGFLALDDVDFVPTEEYNRIVKRCNPEPGDILISCSGSIGRVCRVPNNLKFVMVRSVALVKFDWEKNSSKFYEYLFQSPLLQRQIEKSKKATAQANLFLGPIKNLDVIVCSLEEQQKVVEILESKLTVCDKIEETISQSLLQAETLKQSILKKAFEGRLV